MSISDDDLTHDAFLGGRLSIWQPKRGFRAGVDAVILAAACPARAGDHVLDLGCGVGTAALSVLTRVPGATATGVELQPDYAVLAQRNAAENALPLRIEQADLRHLPAELRNTQFHHVIMNPPYYDRRQGTAAADAGRDAALAGDTPLADWIDIGIRRLRPKGTLTIIQRIERLPDVLSTCSGRLGSIVLTPLAPRVDRDPQLFILQGKNGGRAPFRLAASLVLHHRPSHESDAEDYTALFRSVLRDGAALPI